MRRWIVFEHRDRFLAPRSIEPSASVDPASKNRRSISLRKYASRKRKIVQAPKNETRLFC